MKLRFMMQYICAGIIIDAIFLTTGTIAVCDTNNKGLPADANDVNGPTVILNYNSRPAQSNSFAAFMYFVPLLSPTSVIVFSDVNNDQQVRTVAYERKTSAKAFYVKCEFAMTGPGYHKYVFDHNEIIAAHAADINKGDILDNLIDYICFEGPGSGEIAVKGTISGLSKVVNEVYLRFNAGGHTSPVTLGVYNVSPKNDEYKYENRTGEIVARVDAFIFKNGCNDPRMDIKLASIGSSGKPHGFLARLKGAIANFLLEPPKVAKTGNDAMLDFGTALFDKRPSFTFPKAGNIKTCVQESATGN